MGFELTACDLRVIQKERRRLGGGTATQGLRAVCGEVPRPQSYRASRWNPKPQPPGL